MNEKVIQFGTFKTLTGVVTEPEKEAGLPAVVLLNAGLIHRIGPNRVYVKLARRLAGHGYRVMRIDLSGIGDSLPRPDHLPIEKSTIDDTVQALDYLAATYGTQRFLVMGHCAGAFHSFRSACQDGRIEGVVMMNPDGGEADWVEYDRKRKLARYYQNYYGQRKPFAKETWKRLLGGDIHLGNVLGNLLRNILWNRVAALSFKLKSRLLPSPPSEADRALFTVEATLRKLPEVSTRLLLVYSEGATSLERTRYRVDRALKQLGGSGRLALRLIPHADHTFTLLESQEQLIQEIEAWM